MDETFRWTEAAVLDVLERRFAKAGNGGSGEYAFLRQVRNDAGFKAKRTFDAMAISLWPSRGFSVHVFEVKTARSDWLRELKDGAKAEAAAEVANHFSVVAPPDVVKPEEVPPTWGFIRVTESGKHQQVIGAPQLRRGRRDAFPAGLVVSMLRSAGAVPGAMTVEEEQLEEARLRGFNEAVEIWRPSVDQWRDLYNKIANDVSKFSQASGVAVLPASRLDPEQAQREMLVRARRVRAAMADELHLGKVRAEMTHLAGRLEQAAADLRDVIAEAEE